MQTMTEETARHETTFREEAAWAAGFIDGEGCFMFSSNKAKFAVAQVRREPLERLCQLFGLGRVTGPYAYQANQKPHYRYELTGLSRIQFVMDTVWPFLSEPKREQASEVLLKAQLNGRPVEGEFGIYHLTLIGNELPEEEAS